MKLFYLLLFLPAMVAAQSSTKKISNAYFNQLLPGNEPVLFAAESISDEFGNRDMAISPKGDELFYTFQYRGGFIFSTIMYSKKINGKWSSPEVATFCGQYNDLEPAFSPDGTKLYFSSNRPLKMETKKDYDIWFVTKQNGVWSDPKNMDRPVNSDKNEFYPSIAKSWNIYFTREMEGKDEDIVVSRFLNNHYDTVISLPGTVNTDGGEFNAFVDPDEQFVIFTGYKRKGNYGAGDLFISKKNDKGEWMEAKNMGDKINGTGLTYCPFVSQDKKYFFFTSSRGIFKTPFTVRQKTKDLKKLMHSPWNGWDNIFWVEARGVID
jgi:Tol biopolymer transport system component